MFGLEMGGRGCCYCCFFFLFSSVKFDGCSARHLWGFVCFVFGVFCFYLFLIPFSRKKCFWVSTQNIKLAGSPKALCFCFVFLSLSLCWPKLLWKKALLLFFASMLTWLDGELHWCLMLLCHQMAQMLAKPGSTGQLPINPNLVASKMSAVSTCGLLIWRSLLIFCIIYIYYVYVLVWDFFFFFPPPSLILIQIQITLLSIAITTTKWKIFFAHTSSAT